MSKPETDTIGDSDSLEGRVAILEEQLTTHELVDPLEWAAVCKLVNQMAGYEPGELPDDHTMMDTVEEAVERLNKLEALEERVAAAESTSEAALGMARAIDDGDDAQDVDVARWTSRNYLVKEAAEKGKQRNPMTGHEWTDAKVAVTNREVRDMAEPEHDLAWQTVQNAWNKLEQSWDCFEQKNREDSEKVLRLTEVPPDPVIEAAEHDLGRDDLAKRLVGGKDRKRGSAGGN